MRKTLTRLLPAVGLIAATAVVWAPGAHADGGGAEPSAAPSAEPPAAPSAEEFASYAEEAFASSGLPGLAVAVTHGDEVLMAEGYGTDSRGEPIDEHSPMRLASVTKSLSAYGVMNLVEQGEIDLDAPLVEQLPEFTMADGRAEEITPRQLLDQTSGLSDRSIDIADLEESESLEDYVSRLEDDSLTTDPGAEWAYCNVNYNIAARLVEVVTGRSYDDYMKDEVFGALGMEETTLSAEESDPANGRNGLFGMWIEREEIDGFLDHSASGGAVSTASDMGRWLVSQTGEGPVSQDGLDAMRTASEVGDYGLGWGVDETEGGRGLVSHSGNLFTSYAAHGVVPETGYGFAVMADSALLTDDTYTIMEGLIAISEGRDPVLPEGDGAYQWILGGITLLAAGLGVVGVVRSGRWAAARAARPLWVAVLRCLPLALPVALMAGYRGVITVLTNGRHVTWEQLTYFSIPLTVAVFAAGLAGLAVIAARVFGLVRAK
ncbi:serine hydrolase [Nocardiopsis sp. RSe5-2]|uniref:Serine hydrolase n=1 Tax=Nocardiopsis endophytica TaxID=3018445 RepID=A0ABT4UCW9_9ACTN|nr:serine hydrolase domain-containing protein [Nocardiopsis endophytica]MDA2814839.1 serine hydrolase [Nocardiopsis endophytica]